MTDRFNTIAGWLLFSGIVALGLNAVSERVFDANKPERPETMGYPIEGVVEGGAEAGPDLGTLLAAADPAAGQKIFAKCSSCHTIDQGGANGIGPNLYGTVGEPIGMGKAGFAFSGALSGHGGNWTYENLFDWLKSPNAFASGTKMTFAGLSSPEDRANVIAYLKANGGGPDYPAPAAPAADKADAAAATAPDAGPGAAVSGADANPVEAAGAAGQPAPVAGKAADSLADSAAH
uniref:c-type cytochrome n=1 Tax=Altererythrobacter segetis TaxID=1104773 RepID=UPI00140B71AE|nr:cytochrome c family protein [Altererythrobacter segetis]